MSEGLDKLKSELNQLADPQKAVFLQRFFKTGVGEYGYGDVFLGLTVPQSRKLAMKYKKLPLKSIEVLLSSKVHEERFIALIILIYQFEKGDERAKRDIFEFYLSHTKYINNWDLVDLSAPRIIGKWIFDKNIKNNVSIKSTADIHWQLEPLPRLAKSSNLWEKRIAIIATFNFIVKGYPGASLEIAEILVHDREDLIQKAVGWMLREVGKRCSREDEEIFLKKHYKIMPRTMLRYAIERFPKERRSAYLLGKI